MRTYQQSTRTSQLLLQSIGEGSWNTWLVWVVEAYDTAETQECSDEAAQVEQALARGDMSVLFRTEYTQDIIILVDRLSKVASFLLIPPVTVGVSELTLHTRGIRVNAALYTNGVNLT